jgi:hypothetical protein
MYCPQCASENQENASFCRGCGANISLVPQALTGSVPASVPDEWAENLSQWRRRRDVPSVEKGIKNIFMGVAFILAALGAFWFAPSGQNWWFWLFIPAFAMLGGGVAEMVRFKMRKTAALPAASRQAAIRAAAQRPAAALPRLDTSELMQPPSISDSTTRHLEPPVESKRRKV